VSCNRYHTWIKDAAIASLRPGREAKLIAHLNQCAGCRDLLAAERQLVLAIDQGLMESLTPPSHDFTARTRLRLAEEGELGEGSRPPVRGLWAPAFALGIPALALLFLVFWFLNRPAGSTHVPIVNTLAATSQVTTSARKLKEIHAPLAASAKHQGALLIRTAKITIGLPGSRGHQRAPDTQILVQPGQWAVIAQMNQTLAAAGVVSGSHVNETEEPKQPTERDPIKKKIFAINTIEIDPVAIEPVEVKNVVIAKIFSPNTRDPSD
jgi:hypothetical protein